MTYGSKIKKNDHLTFMQTKINTAIEPWLTLKNGEEAIAFYRSAFNAEETYRLSDPGGGLVVRLAVNGAGFWISGESGSNEINKPATPLGGDNVRMILIVDDPEKLFAQAIKAGAKEVFPVGEEYGWRLGRISDPFGMHWEIGHQL